MSYAASIATTTTTSSSIIDNWGFEYNITGSWIDSGNIIQPTSQSEVIDVENLFHGNRVAVFGTLNSNTYDLFVSVDGDDENNNGTKTSPFQTIQRAIDYIQDSLSLTIYVDSGVYYTGFNNTIFSRGKSLNIVGIPSDDSPQAVYPQLNSLEDGMLLVVLPAAIPYISFHITECPLIPVDLPTALVSLQFLNINNITFNQYIYAQGCMAISVAQLATLSLQSTKFTPILYNPQLVCLWPRATLSGSDISFINGSDVLTHTDTAIYAMSATVQLDQVSYSLNISSYAVYSNKGSLVLTNVYSNVSGCFFSFNNTVLEFSNFTLTNYGFIQGTIISIINISQYAKLSNILFTNIGYSYGISISLAPAVILENIRFGQGNFDLPSFLLLQSIGKLSVQNLAISDYNDPDRRTTSYIEFSQVNGTLDNIILENIADVSDTPLISITGCDSLAFSNLEMNNNAIPLMEIVGSTVTLTNTSMVNNTLFSLLTCTTNSVLQLINASVKGNKVTAIDASTCHLSISDSTFGGNLNIVHDQYPLVYTSYGQLDINNVQFTNNIGFDIVSLKNSRSSISSTDFITNQYGFQISALDCHEINGSALFFYGNIELQPVLSFSNSTINLKQALLQNNVYPANITNCQFEFDQLDVIDTTGDSSLNIVSSTGAWRNSRVSNFTISPTDTTISLEDSNVLYSNCTFDQLSSPGYPIGIMTRGTTTFQDCLVNNTIGSLSGGFKVTDGKLIVINSYFGNNAGKVNAVLFASNAFVILQNCIVENNVGSDSIIQIENTTFEIVDCTFSRNYLSRTIHFVNASGDILNSKFTDNSDLFTIILIEKSNITVVSTEFITSFTLNDGSYSTVQLFNSKLDIVSSHFYNNLGTQRPSIYASSSQLNINYTRFENNSNLNGVGGDIYMEKSYGLISSSQFKAGGAHIGGCIYMALSFVELRNNTFLQCEATIGGAIYIDSSVANISQSKFSGCLAQKGDYTDVNYIGSVYCGGAIAIAPIIGKMKSTVWITGSMFMANQVSIDGGALWTNDPRSTISISKTSFNSNQASGGGGAIFWETARTFDKSNIFNYNIAVYAIPFMGSYVFYILLDGNTGDQYSVNLTLFSKETDILFSNHTGITIQSCLTTQYLDNTGICRTCPVVVVVLLLIRYDLPTRTALFSMKIRSSASISSSSASASSSFSSSSSSNHNTNNNNKKQ
ncbi:hypothetical protein PPL_07604 [Heterostelium album PN500]|uniref:Adhesin-like protein n=1 Tax=Heterostelium pallidum (strain ATCC 26659 / Pp 5 / PN500) TaxID=670386 RepID=D3BGF3_HETP5|nr:hypothetical protein PPL_07604 [Heterostelium album PN500]EFA79553.1 hypothetical protein PPL_07604 [Heterostelium album PN500]|eukprot:XP_020431674.1 hypothetical protein PPL_07604 [Heterostelium album PN500]